MHAVPRALTALLVALAIALPSHATTAPALTPREHRRGVEQTFLTFPEWFLVFSPAEYAELVRNKTPDEFVFWGHIGQFWRSYAAIAREIDRRGYPPNPGYHLMIMVIGVSTTVEYAIRSAYETLIGRVTSAVAGELTEEDRYGARVAQEYVDFIRVRPWYEFDFAARLKGLWTRVPASGAHPLRKWERRYALTTEYLVKAAYGKLIERATRSVYEVPKEVTAVVVEGAPCPGARVEAAGDVDASHTLVLLPRYEAFTPASQALARCNLRFIEIAGNRTDILVSTVGSRSAAPVADATLLFALPILTRPAEERRAYVVPVSRLTEFFRAAEGQGLVVEHVFDY